MSAIRLLERKTKIKCGKICEHEEWKWKVLTYYSIWTFAFIFISSFIYHVTSRDFFFMFFFPSTLGSSFRFAFKWKCKYWRGKRGEWLTDMSHVKELWTRKKLKFPLHHLRLHSSLILFHVSIHNKSNQRNTSYVSTSKSTGHRIINIHCLQLSKKFFHSTLRLFTKNSEKNTPIVIRKFISSSRIDWISNTKHRMNPIALSHESDDGWRSGKKVLIIRSISRQAMRIPCKSS